jgi:hypothetical protein
MRYELKTIESLIETHLQPQKVNNKQLNGVELSRLQTEIQSETKRVKDALIESVFNFKKDKQVERYIQQHQSSLIRICNNLIRQISTETFRKSYQKKETSGTPNAYFIIYAALEHVLTFIEHYFSKYFNQNEKIPTSYQIIGQMEFREKLKAIKRNNECSLCHIALSPINEFTGHNSPVTFRKLIYLKTLYDEIRATCSKCDGGKKECVLMCTLVYLNYNSFKFFNHVTDSIRNEFEAQKSHKAQVEILSTHLKKLNQINIKPNIAYKYKHTSIKDQLAGWILEEICLIEKVHQPKINFPVPPAENPEKTFKIKTNHSVSTIALFFRLCVETNLIENSNHKELLTFLANHISTKNTENISPESFRTKYYAMDEASNEALKEIIIKLLNKLQNDN